MVYAIRHCQPDHSMLSQQAAADSTADPISAVAAMATPCSASPSPPTALQHSKPDVGLASTGNIMHVLPHLLVAAGQHLLRQLLIPLKVPLLSHQLWLNSRKVVAATGCPPCASPQVSCWCSSLCKVSGMSCFRVFTPHCHCSRSAPGAAQCARSQACEDAVWPDR